MSEVVQKRTGRGLKLSDVLVMVLVSLVLGVVYHFWSSVYNLFSPCSSRPMNWCTECGSWLQRWCSC